MPLKEDSLNLEMAWRRAKADSTLRSTEGARVFVLNPHELELAEENLSDYLKRLGAKIAAGYQPGSAIIADIPKGNGAVRPAALLNLDDRVVYTAIAGTLLPPLFAGLKWAQGTKDFSYVLSGSEQRVEFFTNRFNGWKSFRDASIARIEAGATHVDDLALLISDIRHLGGDADVTTLLSRCLNRWCVVNGRGVPQGMSASDLLSKVYLNSIDRALADGGIECIRYVDDIRIFCNSEMDCKRALTKLVQLLRARGLNLQSAKTEILTAEKAKTKILGATPIVEEVNKKYKAAILEVMSDANPSIPISELVDRI